MLYLLQPAANDGGGQKLPLRVGPASHFERALLAADATARHGDVRKALADDPAISEWAVETAKVSTCVSSIGVEEATAWLSEHLTIALASALNSSNEDDGDATELDWRLPALVKRLIESEQKIAAFNERLEREKLAAMKELAYGASHEINNPLANIAARAQTLLDDETEPERQRKLLAIHRQAMRAHEMISDIMLFARPPKLRLSMCDVCQVVQRVVDEHLKLAAEREIQLSCDVPAKVELIADETQVAVAVGALVTNALEAVGCAGHVWVSVRQKPAVCRVEIAVADDGPGISPEVRRHMFDPFFSGRDAGRGLGFGLSKCWRIATEHGGDVVVNQPAGRGAELVIRLKVTAGERR